ncbi:Fic family protein [Legionella clemsonensis]|uniref:Fic/DOC family protein n=1 Tax=Legionella clemsonensis TaxID=1867846 RepID=A0A222P2K3_9GAMM|nr:Fic family protein [Legionella clemsonensis]ASQ46057.1 Fic/DOC family protein [Legionella clemsonensis]
MLDLAILTEFNHALVYGFEPESSPQRLAGSETFEDALFPEAGQHHDVLNAYLYAQNIILPRIQEIGLPNVSPTMLIEWVKTIHGFIGKSLMQAHGRKSGEYTNEIVFRWHLGAELGVHFTLYLSDLHECKSPQQFAKFLNKQFDMNYQSALDFINLLEKIAKDKNYTIHESLQPSINYESPGIKGILVQSKLASAYNLNLLSEREKSTVNKIVKICMLPPLIPEAMNRWAQTTLSNLHACDTKDLKKVSEFLAITFYELTEVHPFGNANGRTATCLINTFLRALGYPSIVLRYPGEREDKDSLYQKALAEIDSSLVLLIELIHTRVIEAQEKAFSNEKLKKLITLRVALSDLLQETKSKYPEFNLIAFQKQVFSSPEVLFAMQMADETEASIFVLSMSLDKLSHVPEKLEQEKQKRLTLFSTSTLDSKQINAVINALEKISGQSGWKHNAKKGFVTWLEISDMKKAKEIACHIESTKTTKVTLSRRADNKIPVIKCEDIDYQKLINAADLVDDEKLSKDKGFDYK